MHFRNENIEETSLTRPEIMKWLREQDEKRLKYLWIMADTARRSNVGDEVHLRGIIAISNRCVCLCRYCGINAVSTELHRYAMMHEEIMQAVRKFELLQYHTVVLQSGEDPSIKSSWITKLIRKIKSETTLAITLSLGERHEREFAEWKEAGADRYLLKFETSNRALYENLRPGKTEGWQKRIEMLHTLNKLGYEVGSGVMIGIPGQKFEDLANDLDMFRDLNLDMIGIGPYIPHPATSLGREFKPSLADSKQVPNDKLTTYKMLALTRLACPLVNIPSTTSLATIAVEGREGGLTRGANVIMPDFTPETYRKHYDIYPAYHREYLDPDSLHHEMVGSIESMGRIISSGSGASLNFIARHQQRKSEISPHIVRFNMDKHQ